ncbi:MAG: helix-turn-helix domain-containing protein [Clostridia bacterium]|nr:helix-turn-helix domain-containing protein [Clostridia bacterium]
METSERKSHWSHSDSFQGERDEYIKSFVHRNYAIGFHTHSFYELNIILSGRGEHTIEQMKREVSRGCVFLIPPNIRHSYRNLDSLDVYHMLIHRDFLPNCFGEFYKTTGFSLLFEIEPYFRARYQENMFLTLSESQLSAVLSDISLIRYCEALSDSHLYVNAVAKKILAFLCLCISEQNGMDKLRAKPNKELLCIADSLNFIHQNYEERITVEMLAERQNMSRATYIRWFNKTCGCSPHQYLMQFRLKKATDELSASQASVAEVAQRCGFYDASHLRRALNKKESL